ncbi:DUF4907 domain-containing protein [Croceitalea rosinachiae]|uniref:DUF4907 domain-containing protein n=1 Tax=Croceitalea rosinachiae TaxID=3075596 RepID=A0ABU3A9D9_9FLAO|nr:DUF4907 domain-containing protein [Croceitalea sp. F388]MDT0606806.1 DUF4907 domain-containing protein [Croceitalea sp. F388]
MNLKKTRLILVLAVIILGIIGIEFLYTNSNSQYELQVEENQEGWEYTIYYDNKILIKQRNIPGISNRKTFKTKIEAEKIGYLVINRLEKRLSPKISKFDLDQNGITY